MKARPLLVCASEGTQFGISVMARQERQTYRRSWAEPMLSS